MDKKSELKTELTNMRSLLEELESALNGISGEEERLLKELDESGGAVFDETKKLQERISKLLNEA
jgi:flagellar biosynthesis chaperone FliJ